MLFSGQTREERLRDHRVPGDLIPTHYELEFRPELSNQSGRLFVSDNNVQVGLRTVNLLENQPSDYQQCSVVHVKPGKVFNGQGF